MNVFNIQINHPSLVESIHLYLYHWNQCFCSFNMIKQYFDNIIVSMKCKSTQKESSMNVFSIQINVASLQNCKIMHF